LPMTPTCPSNNRSMSCYTGIFTVNVQTIAHAISLGYVTACDIKLLILALSISDYATISEKYSVIEVI